jgi:hypothetical protein
MTNQHLAAIRTIALSDPGVEEGSSCNNFFRR